MLISRKWLNSAQATRCRQVCEPPDTPGLAPQALCGKSDMGSRRCICVGDGKRKKLLFKLEAMELAAPQC